MKVPEIKPDRRLAVRHSKSWRLLVHVVTMLTACTLMTPGCGRVDDGVGSAGERFVDKLTDTNFEREVLQSRRPVVVSFHADWCIRCEELRPIVEQLAAEFKGRIRFGTVDTDANRFTAEKYGIQILPTVIVFRSGHPIKRMNGLPSERQLTSLITTFVDRPDDPPRPLGQRP